MILAWACTAPLHDELVVPGDVAAETWIGEEGSGLGTQVATGGGVVVATAPGTGEVWTDGELSSFGPGTFAVWVGADGPRLGWAGRGIYTLPDGEEVHALPAARAFAGSVDGYAWATEVEVVSSRGERWELAGVRDLAVAEDRVVAVACDGGCEAWQLDASGLALLGPAGEGGRVTLHQSVACYSDPELSDDGGGGVVRCEDGREVRGEPGDHLGRALGGGYAAGGLNPLLVPHRARIVPLDGGTVLAVDRSVETRPLSLAGDDHRLVVGVPGYPLSLAEAGAVHVVVAADLP